MRIPARRLLALLLLAPVTLFAAESVPEVPSLVRPDFSKLERLAVESIIDGDTIVVRRGASLASIRLIGVDAPETVHPSKPVQEYGCEACRFLFNLLRGEEVWIERDPAQPTDKYGRELAYLHRSPDGLNVNAEVIRQGYGHAYLTYPHPYLEQFNRLGQRARALAKGLHGPAPSSLPSAAGAPTPQPLAPTPAPAPGAGGSGKTDEITVYVTRTGEKYHRAGCRYLAKSSIPMPLEDAKARYGPCSVCDPPR